MQLYYKVHTGLPQTPAVVLFGIDSQKLKPEVPAKTPPTTNFIAALLIITENWKQPIVRR